MSDYIPRADAEFNNWTENFINNLQANKTVLGLADADIAPLLAAQTAWTTAYSNHIQAQADAQGAQQGKTDARQSFETNLRAMARRVQAQPSATDRLRAVLGLATQDKSARIVTKGPPESRPLAIVDTSQRLRHTIKFIDEATPNSNARPDGAIGCEIWSKVGGAAPVDASELRFLALDTRTPYTVEYGGEDASKTAYYMLRWVNSKGEQGPWSQTVSATITA